MGGGQIISPKNGGSVDAIVNFWGECNSNVIFMEGVEIKLIDFGKSIVPFHENLGEGKIFHKKLPEWGEVSIYSKKMGVSKYFSNEMEYLMHQIWGLQSLKWGKVTYIWTQLWGEDR